MPSIIKIPKRKYNKKKLARLAAIVLMVLLLIGGGVFLWMRQSELNEQNKEVRRPESATLKKINEERTIAITSDSVDAKRAAIETMRKLIDQGGTASDRQAAAHAVASIYLNMNDAGSAIPYAKRAEEILPDASTSQMIAIVAEAMDDKPTAIEYYRISLNRIDKNSPMYKVNHDALVHSIEALEGKAQ